MSPRQPERTGVDPRLAGRVASQLAGRELAPDEGAPTPDRTRPDDAESVPELHSVDVPDELRAQIEDAMSRYPQLRSASIPALWAVQRRYGWCSPEGMRQAAAVMGVTPAYLESVATFYDLFQTEPVGRHRVLVCHNISCWMNGGDELLRAFCERSGADYDEADHGGASSPDGELFVKGFECMGACDIAPMASIDERYFGPLETSDVETVLDQLRSGAEVLPEKHLAKRPAAGGDVPADSRVATDPAASGDLSERAPADDSSRASETEEAAGN